jgi:hypothetical protein
MSWLTFWRALPLSKDCLKQASTGQRLRLQLLIWGFGFISLLCVEVQAQAGAGEEAVAYSRALAGAAKLVRAAKLDEARALVASGVTARGNGIAHDIQVAQFWANLAIWFGNRREMPNAVVATTEALAIGGGLLNGRAQASERASLFYSLGHLQERILRDPDQALFYYERALELDPHNSMARERKTRLNRGNTKK